VAELNRLAAALAELSGVLQESGTPFMIIGGIAVLIWGEPRATQDVDVTVSVPEDRIPEFVDAMSRRVTVLPANPTEFVLETHVLPVVTSKGVHVDVIWAGLPYEENAIERAIVRELGGVPIRVCTPEDLILHKLASVRPRSPADKWRN
jgi:Nucleotidyl transferase of unknown function (DUF2204)